MQTYTDKFHYSQQRNHVIEGRNNDLKIGTESLKIRTKTTLDRNTEL